MSRKCCFEQLGQRVKAGERAGERDWHLPLATWLHWRAPVGKMLSSLLRPTRVVGEQLGGVREEEGGGEGEGESSGQQESAWPGWQAIQEQELRALGRDSYYRHQRQQKLAAHGKSRSASQTSEQQKQQRRPESAGSACRSLSETSCSGGSNHNSRASSCSPAPLGSARPAPTSGRRPFAWTREARPHAEWAPIGRGELGASLQQQQQQRTAETTNSSAAAKTTPSAQQRAQRSKSSFVGLAQAGGAHASSLGRARGPTAAAAAAERTARQRLIDYLSARCNSNLGGKNNYNKKAANKNQTLLESLLDRRKPAKSSRPEPSVGRRLQAKLVALGASAASATSAPRQAALRRASFHQRQSASCSAASDTTSGPSDAGRLWLKQRHQSQQNLLQRAPSGPSQARGSGGVLAEGQSVARLVKHELSRLLKSLQ